MKIQCPKCQDTFSMKANANRARCPSCGFRQDTPEAGWPAGRKAGADSFAVVSGEASSAAAKPMSQGTKIAIGAVLLLLAAGIVWAVTMNGPKSTGTTGDGANVLPPAPANFAECANAPHLPAGAVASATIETNMGTIELNLTPDLAPVTVANFVCLAQAHYFDGLKFHRIITNFMMQGGDPKGDGTGGPGYKIVDEFSPKLRFSDPGVLAMANSGPNTGGSQFFITFVPTPSLNDKHAIFGHATPASMGVIQNVNKQAASGSGTPTQPVTILKVTVRATAGNGSAMTSTSTGSTSAAALACPVLWMPTPHTGALQMDTITAGQWNVSAETDQVFVWLHNTGKASVPYTWSATGAAGAPLPTGWSVTFAKPTGTLQPCGAPPATGIGPDNYPDWAGTLATVTIPASQPAGDVAAELHAGDSSQPFTFHVQAVRGTVTKVGDKIQTCYDLHGEKGDAIQKGPFPLTVGAAGAVTGYSFGVAGLALGESQTLIVPPPFAYAQNVNELSGQTLLWGVKVVTDPKTCPT